MFSRPKIFVHLNFVPNAVGLPRSKIACGSGAFGFFMFFKFSGT